MEIKSVPHCYIIDTNSKIKASIAPQQPDISIDEINTSDDYGSNDDFNNPHGSSPELIDH